MGLKEWSKKFLEESNPLTGYAKGGMLPPGSSDHVPLVLSAGGYIIKSSYGTHDSELTHKLLDKINQSNVTSAYQRHLHAFSHASQPDVESEAWD